MRTRLIVVVGALAWAVLASIALASANAAGPTPTPVANIMACSGVGLVSQTVQAVECSTDADPGTSDWSSDYLRVKLQAKAKHDSPPVATVAGWSSNGPLAVDGNQFCVELKADPHSGPGGYAVLVLALSWDGVSQPIITVPLSRGTVSYCGAVPAAAENFWWTALGVTGTSEGDAKLKLQFVGVSFATVS